MHLPRKTSGNLSKFLTVLGIIGATLAGLAIVTKLAKNNFADNGKDVEDDFWDDAEEFDFGDDFCEDEEEEESAEVPVESEEQAEEASPNETI